MSTFVISYSLNIDKSSKEHMNQNCGVESIQEPCLIAVSKTKPFEMIVEAYNCGQRDFGENYVQELTQKADEFKKAGYDDIRWHFIGHLQRNKTNNLLDAPNLEVVQTVDSIKLADALNKSWKKKNSEKKLKVFAQVNTSGEESEYLSDKEIYKSGCTPSTCTNLVNHIISNCDCLQVQGLMTIGSYQKVDGPNMDFISLVKCREKLCEDLKLHKTDIQLSMGMSHDYQKAILAGSTTVRIGSSIFGARDTKPSSVTGVASVDVDLNPLKMST